MSSLPTWRWAACWWVLDGYDEVQIAAVVVELETALAAAHEALELSSDSLLAEQLFRGPQFISRVLSVSHFHLGAENGLQILDRLRQGEPGWAGVPALLIMCNLDAELSGRTAAMGVAIAHKPLPPRRLLGAIARLLDGPQEAVQQHA